MTLTLRSLPSLMAALGAAVLLASCASSGPTGPSEPQRQAAGAPNATYTADETVEAIADWLGVSAETAGSLVERAFSEHGRPNAYIYGEEGSAALTVGVRYGKGRLVTKTGEVRDVYWQGPSIGFDVGGNASKTFTLVYNLRSTDMIYQRFPGVDGSAYFIGGVGLNYQKASDIVLAPMRAGVGLRAGANVGYLAYSRQRNILPF